MSTILSDSHARQRVNRSLRARGVPAKACSKCHTVKALTLFPVQKRGADGRQPHCRSCASAYQAAYRSNNPESVKAYARASRQVPEHREAQNAYMREYMRQRRQDPSVREMERDAERKRRYDPATRDLVLAKDRDKESRRRARALEATLDAFTLEELYASWDEADYAGCYWCDGDFTEADPMHVDHLVPLARGGAHAVHNLVPAHASCNTSKGAKDPYAYALERYPWLVKSGDILT